MKITDEMVKQYKRLAYKIAMPYVIGFPKIADDLKASAMLGLCEGIKSAFRLKHHDPGAMIVLNVQFEVIKCLQSTYCIIRLPRSLLRKEKLKAYLNKEEFSFAKLYPKIIFLVEQFTDARLLHNDVEWQKIKQEISDIDLTEIERKVLVYRLSDYTYKEIAKDLGCSDVWALKTMQKVRKKWLKQKM